MTLTAWPLLLTGAFHSERQVCPASVVPSTVRPEQPLPSQPVCASSHPSWLLAKRNARIMSPGSTMRTQFSPPSAVCKRIPRSEGMLCPAAQPSCALRKSTALNLCGA